ncbi:hypothetical protein CsSME_00053601 [Camellia sinensis var. sinensis]
MGKPSKVSKNIVTTSLCAILSCCKQLRIST